MKKTFLLIITICLAVSLLPLGAAAISGTLGEITEDTHVINYSMIVSDRYFPFIYDPENEWLLEFVYDWDYTAGKLYLMDMENESIRQLAEDTVKLIRETPNAVFAVTEDNRLLSIVYESGEIKTIYQATRGDITNIEREQSNLCFVEGDYLICFDLRSNAAQVMAYDPEMESAMFYTDGQILWTTDEKIYLMDTSRRTSTVLSYEEVDALLCPPAATESVMQDADVLPNALPLNSQENFPFSDFPDGSYFTKNGSGCSDHGVKYVIISPTEQYHLCDTCNCRRYNYAGQCQGFAYYASDRYAHIYGTTTSRPSTSRDDYRSTFKIENCTDSAMRNYLSGLTKGAYIRVSQVGPNDQGRHSYVYVSCDNTSFVFYDCNSNDACNIRYSSMTYSYLRGSILKYKYVCHCESHTFNGTGQSLSSTKHKLYCGGEGCQGYIVQSHAYNMDSGTTCSICGYSG